MKMAPAESLKFPVPAGPAQPPSQSLQRDLPRLPTIWEQKPAPPLPLHERKLLSPRRQAAHTHIGRSDALLEQQIHDLHLENQALQQQVQHRDQTVSIMEGDAALYASEMNKLSAMARDLVNSIEVAGPCPSMLQKRTRARIDQLRALVENLADFIKISLHDRRQSILQERARNEMDEIIRVYVPSPAQKSSANDI